MFKNLTFTSKNFTDILWKLSSLKILAHTVLPKISYLTSDQESLECKKIMLKALG